MSQNEASQTAFTPFLVNAREEAFVDTRVPCKKNTGKKSKGFKDLDDLRAHFKELDEASGELVEKQSYNLVKKCENCGKPNAISLAVCNSCGTDLPEETSTTDNILYAFCYGVGFPLSIRYQNRSFLVYDDLLSISRCHFNAIPTTVNAPDLRSLFSKPAEGLKLVESLLSVCIKAVKPFKKHKKFRNKTFGERASEVRDIKMDEFLQKYVMCGFNCPPSQYHLHLQFIVLPHIPYQQFMYEKGNHYTKNRFIPYRYVVEALKLSIEMAENDENEKLTWDQTTPVEDIIAHFKAKGLDYDKIHETEYKKVKTAYSKCNSWKKEDFEATYNPETTEVTPTVGDRAIYALAKVDDLVKVDKGILQNYGRPYNAENKPKLGFYKYAKKELLRDFNA